VTSKHNSRFWFRGYNFMTVVVLLCSHMHSVLLLPPISFLQGKHFEISIYSLRQGNYNKFETYFVLSTVLIKFPSPDENSGAGQVVGLPAAKHIVFQRKQESVIIQEYYSLKTIISTHNIYYNIPLQSYLVFEPGPIWYQDT